MNPPLLPEHLYRPRSLWLLFGGLALVLLIGNGRTLLWNQDEAAYAGFGLTMLESGDWLVPDFMWSDVHRKTPLHFWGIGGAYAIFGPSEWATRLTSVLAIMGMAGLLWVQGRRHFGEQVAWLSVVVAGTHIFTTFFTKMALTDGPLLFFETLAAFGILNVLRYRSRAWVVWFWVAIALGTLTKGPPIILFAGFFGLLLLIFHPRRWNLLRLHPWFFGPVAMLPVVAWGYGTYLRDGGVFLEWLYDWYVSRRVTGQVFGQTGPPGYHLGLFLAFGLPWLAFVPVAVASAFRGLRVAYRSIGAAPTLLIPREPLMLMGLWLIAGWLPYEFTTSKLPSYVAAAYPAMMLLIAHQVILLPTGSIKRWWLAVPAYVQLVISVLLGCALVGLSALYLGWVAIVMSTIAAIGLVGAPVTLLHQYRLHSTSTPTLSHRYRRRAMVYYVGCLLLFFVSTYGYIMPRASRVLLGGQYDAAAYLAAQPDLDPGGHIVIAAKRGRPPSLPFYLRTLTGHPIREAYDIDTLVRLYQSPETAALILSPSLAASLSDRMVAGAALDAYAIPTRYIDRTDTFTYIVVLPD